MPFVGGIRAMDPIAVELPWTDVVNVSVPDGPGLLRHGKDLRRLLIIRMVEQEKFDLFSVFTVEGKVHSETIPGGSQGKWCARPDLQESGSAGMNSPWRQGMVPAP